MPNIEANKKRWEREVNAELPGLLRRLLDSDVYGLGDGRKPPPDKYGVYLFSEAGQHSYAGRVGLTERSQLAGTGYSNFRTRCGAPG